jgi:drug/metabolite transporter (DMT)-like permease
MWAATIQRLTGVAVMLVIAAIARPDLRAARNRATPLIATGTLDTLANVLYGLASQVGLVSLAAVLASLFPVVTVLLARVVLHERLSPSQAGGVVSAVVGVALIALP